MTTMLMAEKWLYRNDLQAVYVFCSSVSYRH